MEKIKLSCVSHGETSLKVEAVGEVAELLLCFEKIIYALADVIPEELLMIAVARGLSRNEEDKA